jgi:hypothetical protein
MDIDVGGVKQLVCKNCKSIQMSRKGYVQVVSDEERLSLIGLRSGVVYLSIPEKSTHYLVRVNKPIDVAVPTDKKDVGRSKINNSKYWLKVYALTIEISESRIDHKLDEFYRLKKSFSDLLQISNQFGLRARAVAQPRILVNAGEHYLIKSGGEIGVNLDSAEIGGTWKSYGFSLEVTTSPFDRCGLGLSYKIALSRPSEDNGVRKLRSNSSDGYIDLKCEEEQLVSVLQFDSTQDKQSQNRFASSIPIIGPIFRKKMTEEGQLQLAIYMKVERQN